MFDLPLWFLLIFSGLLGAAIGSFLNVVVYRVPNNISLLGRSKCPSCTEGIKEWDNIPIFSWFILKGKCRSCKNRISFRYPGVEIATTLIFIGITLFTQEWNLITFVLYVYAAVSVSLILIDFDTLRLPDKIVLPSTIFITLLLFIDSLVLLNEFNDLFRGLIAGVLLVLAYGSLFFFSGGRGIGFGDVKLAFLLGLMTGFFSWQSFIVGVAAAWFFGGVYGGYGLATKKMGRKTEVPFGPFLIIGSWIGIIWGVEISSLYLNITGLS
jgi:leader peptidase (prepilin peptidase)/N-methyltransferase